MIPQRHLVILALLEGAVMFSAVLRMVIPELGGVDFSRPPQLAWFVGTLLIAAGSMSHYVLRAASLRQKILAGENVDEDRRQLLTISIAVLIAAALLSLAGPQAAERLLG